MRGADSLVQTLAAVGVERIFSLSGNQIMPVYDACIDLGVEIVHVRHEAAAVFMAEAWAQLTGQVGVALTTAAPGFGNSLGPLYSATKSETPLLLLTGDSPVSQDGRGAFQELDQLAITRPLVKAGFRPTTAAALAEDVAAALECAASGRPGPCHIALAFDVLQAECPAAPAPFRAVEPKAPGADDVAAALARLAAAERPLIVTGPALNWTRAGALLAALEAHTGAAVLCLESPRGLKDPSLGDLAGVFKQADLALALGKSIDFTLGFGAAEAFAPGCPWIVVDGDTAAQAQAARNLGDRLALAVVADPRPTAEALIAGAPAPTPSAQAWRDEVAALTAKRAPCPRTKGISPLDLTTAIQRQIDRAGETVLVLDGGEIGQWAQAGLKGDARLINGPGGAIGGGLCYAVAAALARPHAQVIAVMGDGTVGFHLAEFETAARSGAAFVAVIGNDRRWNAEYQIQVRDYGAQRTMGCELSGARYDLAAAGLGCHGEYVTDPADLDAALARASASGKPACVNVEIDGLAAPSGAGH